MGVEVVGKREKLYKELTEKKVKVESERDRANAVTKELEEEKANSKALQAQMVTLTM